MRLNQRVTRSSLILSPHNLPDGARTSESRRDADRESEEGEHLLCEAQAATHPERESAATTGLQGCVEARIDLSTSLRRLGDGQLPWGHGSHDTLDFLTTASKSEWLLLYGGVHMNAEQHFGHS